MVKWVGIPWLHIITGIGLLTLAILVFWMITELHQCYGERRAVEVLAQCDAQAILRVDTSMGWDCTCTVEGSTAACACDRRD